MHMVNKRLRVVYTALFIYLFNSLFKLDYT